MKLKDLLEFAHPFGPLIVGAIESLIAAKGENAEVSLEEVVAEHAKLKPAPTEEL